MSAEIGPNFDDPRVQALMDGSGRSVAEATRDTTLFQDHKPAKKSLPRSGNVQDFEGRTDEYRGGMIPPQGEVAIAAMRRVLPEIRLDTDQRKFDQLQDMLGKGELTESEVAARWRAYVERKKQY